MKTTLTRTVHLTSEEVDAVLKAHVVALLTARGHCSGTPECQVDYEMDAPPGDRAIFYGAAITISIEERGLTA